MSQSMNQSESVYESVSESSHQHYAHAMLFIVSFL